MEELLSEEVSYDCSIPGPLINPAEANRSYSSVRSDNPFFADSAINSGVGWAAGTSEVGQWMMLDLGSDIPVQAMAIQSLFGVSVYRVDGYQLKYWRDGESEENGVFATNENGEVDFVVPVTGGSETILTLL